MARSIGAFGEGGTGQPGLTGTKWGEGLTSGAHLVLLLLAFLVSLVELTRMTHSLNQVIESRLLIAFGATVTASGRSSPMSCARR